MTWAEPLARLCTSPRPGIYTDEQWARVVDDAARLIDRWHAEMSRNDWTAADVRGLLPMLQGRPVTAVEPGGVVVRNPAGNLSRIHRRPKAGGGTAGWNEGRRAA